MAHEGTESTLYSLDLKTNRFDTSDIYARAHQSITAMDTVQSTPFDPSCTPP